MAMNGYTYGQKRLNTQSSCPLHLAVINESTY